jgi:hypothetical protein
MTHTFIIQKFHPDIEKLKTFFISNIDFFFLFYNQCNFYVTAVILYWSPKGQTKVYEKTRL